MAGMTRTELVKAKAERKGYQEALADILAKLDEGGEEAAREWIANNS